MGVEMFKNLIIILLTCTPLYTWGGDFEFSVGGGYQYSGIIGTQFTFKEDDKKYFISLGLPGISVGMQSTFSNNENHSVGFSVGKLAGVLSADTEYGFITYNYHFSGFQNNSWVLGTGIGYYNQDEHMEFFSSGKPKERENGMALTFDIGYKF
jgi:hypothetical protein